MLSRIVPEILSPLVKQMPNPDALFQDMQKLDDLYEELMWHPDDELQFSIEYLKGKARIIITNKNLEKKQ